MRGFLFAMMALAAGASTAPPPSRRRSPPPSGSLTVQASPETAAAIERMIDQKPRQIIDAQEPKRPGRPWSKTVRTEQQRAAVTAAQAKRDRRAVRNLRRGA